MSGTPITMSMMPQKSINSPSEPGALMKSWIDQLKKKS